MPFDLGPPPALVTFDCYGTLIDWDTALKRYVREVISNKGIDMCADEFYQMWYSQYALPALRGPFRLYRDLLRVTLQDALYKAGASVGASDGADFGDAMAAAEPFPDTLEILHQLAPHVPLATISNSQRDIIAASVVRLDNLFTWVFTAEDTRTYKPHPALFELVLRESGTPARHTVHAAQSQYVDLPRSVPMGIRTVWINRNHQQLTSGTPAPYAELPDLRKLPALLHLV